MFSAAEDKSPGVTLVDRDTLGEALDGLHAPRRRKEVTGQTFRKKNMFAP